MTNKTKKYFSKLSIAVLIIISMIACKSGNNTDKNMDVKVFKKGTFGYDLNILMEADTNLVILKDKSGLSQVLVSAKYQGKVFTSTAEGIDGYSFGWINYDLIKSGIRQDHMNGYGSEDRFWLGPEGGQFSVFFKPDVLMEIENWYTPAPLDYEPWELISESDTETEVKKNMVLRNYKNTEFSLSVNRKVRLLENSDVEKLLNLKIPEKINWVGFETENIVTNTGNNSWTKESGTISIWILSMFNPSPGGTVVIPYIVGDEKDLGKIATTNYFGEIPADRIKIENGILYFKVDGKKRSKLGLAPGRVKPVAGSYDEISGTLTIIQYTVPESVTDYINQLWEIQKEPFIGDVLNSYNDGPLEDGTQMGPFYELESSSPAAFLAPDENITHYHRVMHFVGDKSKLNKISLEVLGVEIEKIISAF